MSKYSDISEIKFLRQCLKDFVAHSSFYPAIGVEFEFYIIGDNSDQLLVDIKNYIENLGIKIFAVTKEEGLGQYEVAIFHSYDIVKLVDDYQFLKNKITELSSSLSMRANFSACPFFDRPSSGLHVHFNLCDANGKNIYTKLDENGDNLFLLHSIAGMLETMQGTMRYFVPNDEDYKRFGKDFHSPSHISWGANNRTVALRIPTVTIEPFRRRIEHRVASPNANLALVISSILLGVSFGLENKLLPKLPKIFGNSSDPQYKLPNLPKSLGEAMLIKHEALNSMYGEFK